MYTYILVLSGVLFPAHIERELQLETGKHGVPRILLRAICEVESHGRTNVVSSQGAVGLCQVMPSSARARGYKGTDVGLMDVRTNLHYASLELHYHLVRYSGDWVSAIASYNAGKVRVCKTGKIRGRDGRILGRCRIGGILNQGYIDDVMEVVRRLELENYPANLAPEKKRGK